MHVLWLLGPSIQDTTSAGQILSANPDPVCEEQRAGCKCSLTRRRDWRELLYTAPGLGQYISGAIMFEETLYQSCESGQPFVDVLQKAGVSPALATPMQPVSNS